MELEMLGEGLRSESCESVILSNRKTFLLYFECPWGWEIREQMKEFERKLGEDFEMILGSFFAEVWVGFGAKLETKLAENRKQK